MDLENKVDLEVGQVIHGFEVEEKDEVPEIDTVAYVMEHLATGARLLYMANDDVNKTFSIAFKTPPANDTGVFHILEHSVLCGSDSYPVKEPFVDLLKSSMQTFLNALTYPDKTVFPVASTNQQDLVNLASIYIDAVLNPAIYVKPRIFEQEGWHYEVAADEARTLTTNGVVYSEMKGALSDPDSVLEDALMRALFPDVPYRYESGGEPEHIPDLTYEEFLDTHSRHYRLDNSYTLIYGDLDADSFLGFLDGKYSAAKVRSDELPNALPLQEPVVNVAVREEMATTPDNACIAQGYVIGTTLDRERISASQILLNAVMGSNEAPLKRAILDSGIAGTASSTIIAEVQQPFAILQVNGLKVPDAEERFRRIVRDECERLADGGLDHGLLEASIANIEFGCREGNLNADDGVDYAVTTLSSWLYDDGMATTYLHYADMFEHMRQKVDSGYFEDLLRELFVDNDHMASVELVPVDSDPTEWETAKMASLRATLGDDELDAIAAEAEALHEMQGTPDLPEDTATIPRLHISDVGDAPAEAPYEYQDDRRCIRHRVDTRGIVYASRFFDLGCVSADEIPYVWLMSKMLAKVGTEDRSAADLVTLMKSKLGNLSFAIRVYENLDDVAHPHVLLEANGSALSENLGSLVDITNEVLSRSVFDDEARIRNVLEQDKVYSEQLIVSAAHMVSGTRMGSRYRPAQVIQDQLLGVEHYRAVKGMLDGFDDKAPQIVSKLDELSHRIFHDDDVVYSFAGTDADYERYWDRGPVLGVSGQGSPSLLEVEPLGPVDEAFIIPSNVAFVTSGYDCLPMGTRHSGANSVAANALSLEFLWNEVRVKGGAYGVGGRIPRTQLARFYSYRDPHIDQTVVTFKDSGRWLRGYEPDEEVFEGYKISTVATSDAPEKPRTLVSEQNARYFCGISDEEKGLNRQQAIDATVEEMHSFGDILDQAMDNCITCAFASKEMIEKSGIDFEVVDIFAE